MHWEDDARPKLVLTASCGIEGQKIVAYKPLLDEAIRLAAHAVERVVLLHADARVRPNLRLEDAGGGAGALGERARALLEQIERVEGCGAISQAADNQHDRV